MTLLCLFNLHVSTVYEFVGNADNPNQFIPVCEYCGKPRYNRKRRK